jgi:hypothetical protein
MKPNEHEDDYRGDAELLFPSKYIRAADLQGKDATVTIARIEKGAELVKAGGEKELKPVMHFAETAKMLVLNKTNSRTISALYGGKVAGWIGKKIVLFPAPYRGEQMCVRVRERKGGE